MTKILCEITECIHNGRHNSDNPTVPGACRKRYITLRKVVSWLEVSHDMGGKVYHLCREIEMEE
jgi:hypothetical protein